MQTAIPCAIAPHFRVTFCLAFSLCSPCLKKPIAMGYVDIAHSKADTPIMLSLRGKMTPAVVANMPFVETRYFKP